MKSKPKPKQALKHPKQDSPKRVSGVNSTPPNFNPELPDLSNLPATGATREVIEARSHTAKKANAEFWATTNQNPSSPPEPQPLSPEETKFFTNPPAKAVCWTGPSDGLRESDFLSFKEESSRHPRYSKFSEALLRSIWHRQNFRCPPTE